MPLFACHLIFSYSTHDALQIKKALLFESKKFDFMDFFQPPNLNQVPTN